MIDPKIARLIRSCRKVLRERFPTAFEIVYDNYNFFVIGYCSTEPPSDCVVSLAANAKGLGLSFYYGAGLPDPERRMLGSGSQNRFIRLPTAATLVEPAVAALLDAATRQANVAMPAKGRGTLIIKSVSAKQRPRK